MTYGFPLRSCAVGISGRICSRRAKGGQWEHYAISGVKATVYGNTAIATGAWAEKGFGGEATKSIARNAGPIHG